MATGWFTCNTATSGSYDFLAKLQQSKMRFSNTFGLVGRMVIDV